MNSLGFMTAAVLAVAGAAAVGYGLGRGRARNSSRDDANSRKRLEEYEFYPFLVTPEGHVEFSPDRFGRAVEHLLSERNPRAACELIVIGEQNLVRDTFPTDVLQRYKTLYDAYDGDAVVRGNDAFLENYRRIVNHFGRSFPNTGIEILLHNLVNPSRSLVAIENGAVTGRSVGNGAKTRSTTS